MNLREVREAAIRIKKLGRLIPDSSEAIGYSQTRDIHTVVDYALATVDPEPDAAITADWLREVWGFEYVGEMDKDKLYLDHDYSHYMVVMHERVVVFYLDCDDGDTWPHDLHTRQQFCDLARCLGIPRKQPKPEPEGCTCLSSPNMLYAPCSYCDKQRKDGAK